MSEQVKPRPASTVVLVRDTERGMETLMLKRNKALMFAGGLWVFPGGSLDAEDLEAANGDQHEAARIAAAREAEEEAGLRPQLDDMVLLSHWTTPEAEPRRFATWIWAAPLEADDEVVIDGGEIHDSQWLPVRAAVAAHSAGELGMLPPTFVTLCTLAHYASVKEMVDHERTSPVPEVFPVLASVDDSMAVIFRGDADYDSAASNACGACHRAVLRDKSWEYIYRDVDPAIPPLIPGGDA